MKEMRYLFFYMHSQDFIDYVEEASGVDYELNPITIGGIANVVTVEVCS